MNTVAIVYHSGYGHTAEVARAVPRGAADIAGIEARLIPVAEIEKHWRELDAADAIIFGAPTYMGGVSAPFKAFMDASSRVWLTQGWKDKIAAGFTHSGSQGGGKFNTMAHLFTFAMQHGMIWVGLDMIPGGEGLNRLSFYFGAGGQAGQEPPEEAPNEADKKTGEALGRRVAEVARKLKSV